MQDVTSDIRAKLDIVELVREYTELKKAGRNWKGLCPFHKERTPSFMVSPDKQIAYCFGCHKGGDVFAFVMEVERTDFPGALKMLAEKTGIELPDRPTTGPSRSEKETLIHILEDAQRFYLEAQNQSASALKYWEERGLREETIQHFGLGFSPDSYDDLWKYLREKQWLTDDILKTGMLNSSGNKYYNRFRGRMMFPIYNTLGQAIAFAGRILKDGEPKYLNSPESPVYSKSHTLYNLYRAKTTIREQGFAIVVEGYMDVISSWQQGVENMVAPCGTALTKEQIQLLQRQTDRLYLLYDQDSAGQEAIIRNSIACLEEDIHPFIIDLGDSSIKDVDDFWKTHTKEEFDVRVGEAKPFMEHYLLMLRKQYNLTQVQLKRKAVDQYLDGILALQNSVEQQEYLRLASRHLEVDSPTLYAELQKKKDPRTRVRRGIQGNEAPAFSSPAHVLMAILLTYPHLSQELPYLQHITTLPQELPNALLDFFRKEVSFDIPEDLLSLIPEVIKKQTDMLLLYAEEHGILEDPELAKKVAEEKIVLLLQQHKRELLKKMESAQQSKDATGWYEAYTQLQTLQKVLS